MPSYLLTDTSCVSVVALSYLKKISIKKRFKRSKKYRKDICLAVDARFGYEDGTTECHIKKLLLLKKGKEREGSVEKKKKKKVFFRIKKRDRDWCPARNNRAYRKRRRH